MENAAKIIIIVIGALILTAGCLSLSLGLAMAPDIGSPEIEGTVTLSTVLCFALPGIFFASMGGVMIYMAWRTRGSSQSAPPPAVPPPGIGPSFPTHGAGQGFPPHGAGWSANYPTGQTPWQQGQISQGQMSQGQMGQGQMGIDEQIRQAAARRDYRVTASDVAMLTDLSLEQAKDRLEEMVRQGFITAEIGENREILYTFRQT